MRGTWLALPGLVVMGATLAGAEEPPYKQLLQGDNAQKAAALEKRIDELWAAGKFEEAQTPAEQLLTLRRRVQGKDHWETADANRLVETLRLAAALPASKRAALAAAPAIIAKAEVLYNSGKYAEATPLLRQALAVYKEALGPKHPRTATVGNDLAENLRAQGKAREAEAQARQVLAVREELLGPQHPETAQSLNNLALNLYSQGRAREAEPVWRKALAIYVAVLGPRDPDTARSYNNLAGNLDAQGRPQEAEALFRKALAIYEDVLGPKNSQTATGYNNLANNLLTQGRTREAELLFRKALAAYEDVFGPRHPDTAMAYSNLAGSLAGQGRVREAESLVRQALAIRQASQGPKHPETGESANNLAAILRAQGRVREGEPLLRMALAINEEALGPKHPFTATASNNLGINLQAQGRIGEAEPLLRRALAIRKEVLGPKHPAAGDSYNNLASNFQLQDRVREAEDLWRLALAIAEEVLGPNHPETARRYHDLAFTLRGQGRDQEAEALWRASAEAIEAARLRLAATGIDRAVSVHIRPHLGLAQCRARLGRPQDAWAAAESGLARGVLDDLAARAALPLDPAEARQERERAARLQALDRLLIPLLTAQQLDEAARQQRERLLQERRALDDDAARAAAAQARRAVLPLDQVQAGLAPDDALVFWLDFPRSADRWGCVIRRVGTPAWVRLPGSGPGGVWTAADEQLARQLHDDLAHGEADADCHARRLAQQRLEPLARHLAATAELPAARHLIVVPVGPMAGVPIETLSDRYRVSYAPSGSVFARLRAQHRPLTAPRLLALGDPNFSLPAESPTPQPPASGLYLTLVLPDGNGARHGLRGGDILVQYGNTHLKNKTDLKINQRGHDVPVVVWRNGKLLNDLRLPPGKLGIVISDDPPAVALGKRRARDLLVDARVRADRFGPLPGTRLEVTALAELLPKNQVTLLLDSQASEQELDRLAAGHQLQRFRLLHLATHGQIDPISAAHSALLLARDQLPDLTEQDRLRTAGKKIFTGRLSVEAIADTWELDADLVTLSACQTALGPEGGGEGLLGFSQVLLGRGARSLLLSLWKVDDTATALLMRRFYQNLLGKRDGLTAPLPKAEALREAKRWLRGLPRVEVEQLAGQLAQGAVRASEEDPKLPAASKSVPRPALPPGEAPFAQPRYWAAFILIGDPD
jgi:tetratricopeptide (TPR) repeat protein